MRQFSLESERHLLHWPLASIAFFAMSTRNALFFSLSVWCSRCACQMGKLNNAIYHVTAILLASDRAVKGNLDCWSNVARALCLLSTVLTGLIDAANNVCHSSLRSLFSTFTPLSMLSVCPAITAHWTTPSSYSHHSRISLLPSDSLLYYLISVWILSNNASFLFFDIAEA